MSDKELIVTTAKELFFKLLDRDNAKEILKIDFRGEQFLASMETAFTSVLQMVSKSILTISD